MIKDKKTIFQMSILILICILVIIIWIILKNFRENEKLNNQWEGMVNINENYDLEYLKCIFPLGEDPPFKLGLIIDSKDYVYDFVTYVYGDEANSSMYEMLWIDGEFKSEKMNFLSNIIGCRSIRFNDDDNIILLCLDQILIFNKKGENIQTIEKISENNLKDFFIQDNMLYVLDIKNKVFEINLENKKVVEKLSVEKINGEICLFKDYIFMYYNSSIIVYDINGDFVSSIKIDEEYNEFANLMDYINGKVYFLGTSNLYEADLNDEEFSSIINDPETISSLNLNELFVSECGASMIVDNEENIYISGPVNFENGFVIRYIKK